MAFGVDHEWDALREAVIGVAPADAFTVYLEASQRWLDPAMAAFCRRHAGQRLIDVDAGLARRIAAQADALAALLEREGVTVHRPEPLAGAEREFLAPNGEGTQLFVRDAMIVIGQNVIDASVRLQCRQRERFGLRLLIQRLATSHGARWSSVPLGSPGAVDGPFLEGGDVLLNGPEIYVGMSGCASDMAGIDWLQALLGPAYRVVPMALRSNVLHLEGALGLIKPGLLLHCPEKLIDGLPMSLRDWDKIAVSPQEAERLATSVLVLEQGRVVVEARHQRVIDELRKRQVDAIPLPFDGAIGFGGGLRSAHHPVLRQRAPV